MFARVCYDRSYSAVMLCLQVSLLFQVLVVVELLKDESVCKLQEES